MAREQLIVADAAPIITLASIGRLATIVFEGENGEVGRLPLRLVPGDVAVIVF